MTIETPELISFWTAWNDTATVDTIYTPVFMNDETSVMFDDSTTWPGFVMDGNQSEDPQFGPTIDKVLDPGTDTTYGVGLLDYIAAVRGGSNYQVNYAYQKTIVGSFPWTPIWPLLETDDLHYSNVSMQTGGTDGLPLGDPTWFGYTIPVEMISFTASIEQNKINLKWNTETETNNMGYKIERLKEKLQGWQEIGFVRGSGTTAEPKEYSFIDKNISVGIYSYRLKQIDYDGSFKYSKEIEVELNPPLEFLLEQNYPNPFNPSTKIKYSIPQSSNVMIKVYDILGNEIETLVNEEKPVGSYDVKWNAVNLPSGVYFYQIKAGSFTGTKKMILLK